MTNQTKISTRTIEKVQSALALPGDPAKTRVVVAMSGGVDSSVAAALVKMAGFETIGITLQLYDHGEAIAKKGACCAGQDIHDARAVADKLGIAHYVLDYENRFADAVITDFVDSYLAGETPVPCIKCNQSVKFSDLLAQSKELGAAALVTGHYIESARRSDMSKHFDMLTPFDMARDQSYFLFATTQEQLDFLRFPLARFTKDQIREMANEFGLGIAAKPDSQDICFVPEGNYVDVIAKHAPHALQEGKLVHVDGRELGHHKGIVNFTIGQRKGIGIADKAPLYVTGLEPATATVYVGPRDALVRDTVMLKDLNWLSAEPWNSFDENKEVFVKLRSTGQAQSAVLLKQANHTVIRLKNGEHGISPGQACVIYERGGPGAKVLGGGFIASAFDSRQTN